MRANLTVVVAGATVAIAGYLGLQFVERGRAEKALAEETMLDAIDTVSVVRAKTAEPNQTITLPGNIEAWFQAPIYAQVSGYVKAWYKDYGAEVKKGDVLAEINAPALSAQYEQAKADMEAQRAKFKIAELTAKRYAAMRSTNAVPVQTISVVEADAQVEQAKLNAALQNVRNYAALMQFTTIVAPYDGVVVSREINVGDYVNKDGDIGESGRSKPLFSVADIGKMRLFVAVPESFGEFMRPGQQAKVTLPQLPDRSYVAEFLTVAKGFRTNTRTAITEFTIANDDRSIWPGSYATVEISATTNSRAMTLPSTTLVFDENGTQLACVGADNKVHFKRIAVNKVLDSVIEVREGVTAEDVVIDNPSAALLEGDTVRIVTPAPGNQI